MRKIILLIVIVFLLVGCQSETDDKQTNNGGGTEMKFDFEQNVHFIEEALGMEKIFAENVVDALYDAGMNGSIISIEASGSSERPFGTLEVKSEDGRIYRLHTGRRTVEIILDADTEEILWRVYRGLR